MTAKRSRGDGSRGRDDWGGGGGPGESRGPGDRGGMGSGTRPSRYNLL